MALNYTVTHNGSTWESTTALDSIPLSNGSVTSSITTAGTRTLNCAGKVASNNIVIGAKTLTCAGKIMADDVVITATNAFICYSFYDSSYNQITTITIAGLENAYYYSTDNGTTKKRIGGRIFYIDSEAVEGTDDKFYVAEQRSVVTACTSGASGAVRKFDETNYCLWATASEDLSSYSSEIDVISSAISTVGTGKRNTAWYLANRYNATYFPEHNSISGKVTCWDFCKTCNDNSVNGCNDWFVPSIGEATQLRNSGIWGSNSTEWVEVTKYGTNTRTRLNSSSADSTTSNAWRWYSVSGSNDSASRGSRSYPEKTYFSALIRSF